MRPPASLSRMTLERHATGPGSQQLRLSATLVLRGHAGVHLVAVDDTVELLVALLSTLPYAAHRQELTTAPAGESVEVYLATIGSTRRLVLRLSHDRWTRVVTDLVVATANELTRLGEGELILPLMAAMGEQPASNH